MNKTNCKTGAKISSHNVPILVEWKCPCCFHRWWEDANALEYPEVCPLCCVSLEDMEETEE